MPVGSQAIPAPPEGRVSGAEEVHVCDNTDTTYAIVKFTFPGDSTVMGVVTLEKHSP